MSLSTQASGALDHDRVRTDLDSTSDVCRSVVSLESMTPPKLQRAGSTFQSEGLRSQEPSPLDLSKSLFSSKMWESPVSGQIPLDPYIPQKKRSLSLENLRPAPVYIERCTSFLSGQPPNAVLKTIVDVLEEQQVDFNFNPQKKSD